MKVLVCFHSELSFWPLISFALSFFILTSNHSLKATAFRPSIDSAQFVIKGEACGRLIIWHPHPFNLNPGSSIALRSRSSTIKEVVGSDAVVYGEKDPEEQDSPVTVKISAIASDIDGTLLNSAKTVSDRNINAIRKARSDGILFFPATGKSRQGVYNALGNLGDELKSEGCPGVYLQGLIVYGPGQDNVIFERLLPFGPVKKVVQFCAENKVSLLAYHGDRILCDQRDKNIDKLIDYCEPTPEAIGPLDEAMAERGQLYHKLILMGNDADQITAIRPAVEALVGTEAVITQALGDMLEVLPPGGCKGDGVNRLLDHLGVQPSSLLALGDAENDIEMLELAGVGVVMGNAKDNIFKITQYRTSSNDNDGVAEAIELYCNTTN